MAEISFDKSYSTPQKIANVIVLATNVQQLSALYSMNSVMVQNDDVLLKLFTVKKNAIDKSAGKLATANN